MDANALRSRAEKALPQNAPQWAKRNPLTAVSTLLTIATSVITILVFLGFQPKTLAENEAYVTHQQFNLLVVELVKTVREMEADVAELQQAAGSTGVPSARPSGNINKMAPVVEDPEPSETAAADAIRRLEQAQETINTLQMEQRTK